jgi:hypothetical protein
MQRCKHCNCPNDSSLWNSSWRWLRRFSRSPVESLLCPLRLVGGHEICSQGSTGCFGNRDEKCTPGVYHLNTAHSTYAWYLDKWTVQLRLDSSTNPYCSVSTPSTTKLLYKFFKLPQADLSRRNYHCNYISATFQLFLQPSNYISPTNYIQLTNYFLRVRVTLRLTVSQSVSLSVLVSRYSFLFESYCPVHVGRPLWQEVRSVICQL